MNMNKLSSFLLCAAFTVCLTATNLAAAAPQQTVDLGQAKHFAVLAATPVVSSTGNTIINGDLGISPAAAVTGFFPVDSGPGVVNGTIYTPNQICSPTCVTQTNTVAAAGQTSLLVAYNDAKGRNKAPVSEIGDLGGLTLTPGLYKSTSGMAITGDLTLAGDGVYIFQMASDLTVNTNARVVLTGGAKAANVFWQVGSSAALFSGSAFEGNILALTSITMDSGATLDGRALALNGDVTFISNVVTIPATSKGGKGH